MLMIPVGISNRHVHLADGDIDILFGGQLTKVRELSQPGQYVAEEKVDLITPKGAIVGVRVLGPSRSQSQVEISRTDAFKLGISPPLRNSGDLEKSAGIILKGPRGQVNLSEGVILARIHIHIGSDQATGYGLTDRQIVAVKASSPRPLTFQDVVVRVGDAFRLELHMDTDEANAAFLNNGDKVSLII